MKGLLLLVIIGIAGFHDISAAVESAHPVDKTHPASLGYGMSEDDLSMAVCDKVCNGRQFPDYNYLSVWMSGDYCLNRWRGRLEEEQRGIDRIRKWSMTSLPESPLRQAYLAWMDYYQNSLDSAYEELKNKGTRREMDEYNANNERQQKVLSDHKIIAPK